MGGQPGDFCHLFAIRLPEYSFTHADPIFIDNYRTSLNPVLGQRLNIRYRVSIIPQMMDMNLTIRFSNGSETNNILGFDTNSENPQFYVVRIDAVTPSTAGSYTLSVFANSSLHEFVTNITVRSEFFLIHVRMSNVEISGVMITSNYILFMCDMNLLSI